MNPKYHPDYHRRAIRSVVQATEAAAAGNRTAAEEHLKSAQTWSQANAEHIAKAGGDANGAQAYLNSAEVHFDRIRSLLGRKLAKSTPQLKGPAASAFQGRMRGEGSPAAVVGRTRPQAGYDYKKLHELSSEDQTLAHHKFASKDMAAHQYPVDKETGRLAHAGRSLLPQIAKPEAGSYPQLAATPKIRAGMGVDIHPSSGLRHGFGVVEGPSVHAPGHMSVRVGPSQFVIAREEHLTPRATKGRVEKALKVISDIRKRLK
jgi:hypothetical protein